MGLGSNQASSPELDPAQRPRPHWTVKQAGWRWASGARSWSISEAVEFEAGEVGHGEELAEQSAHVFQMCQDRAGPGVTFPAEDLVLQGGEFIKTAGGFGAGFFDKSGQQGLDLRQPPGMRFKIRMQGDEIGRNGHDRIMVKGGWIYGEKAVLIPSRR